MLVALELADSSLPGIRGGMPSQSRQATRGGTVNMPANNLNSFRPGIPNAIRLSDRHALLTACGCSHKTSVAKPPPPLTVEVAEVIQKDVPIYREWIGTLDGLVNADIKAQVSGYLMQQDYTEGSFVRKGPAAVSDRSAALPGGARPGAGPARAGQGPVGAGEGAACSGGSASGRGGGQSAPRSARRRPLYAARASSRPSPSRISTTPRKTIWRQGAGAGGKAQVETAKAQIAAATAGVQSAKADGRNRAASISDSPASRRPSTASRESPSSRSARW